VGKGLGIAVRLDRRLFDRRRVRPFVKMPERIFRMAWRTVRIGIGFLQRIAHRLQRSSDSSEPESTLPFAMQTRNQEDYLRAQVRLQAEHADELR
jgi:hypothetical protein